MTKPKALYIHIPFCNYICDYCDFTKLQYFSFDVNAYLDALKVELDSYHIGELDTIYIGGGTPSALSKDELTKLLDMVKPYSSGVKEYTFEANPDSLSLDKLKLLKRYHVNRISLGVESTDDKVLASINRHHTFNDVIRLVKDAKEVGIDNINVDLILGLPSVSKAMLIKDIHNLISLKTKHISCYSLTVSPHTTFYIKGINPPSDDTLREYYDEVTKILVDNGFNHYEVSNYSKVGYESLHNLTYWRNEQYYGVGLGASGYISNIRYTNTKNLKKYLAHNYVDYKEEVSRIDDINYQLMLNLRTSEGLDVIAFKKKFGIDLLNDKKEEINDFINNKLIIYKDNALIPTYEGMMLLDTILTKLFY